jgi:N-acetylglucosamine kinase-like BadF-type ATPase
MNVIAESGSTRAEWVLVEDDSVLQREFTEGINPYFQNRREISRTVRLNLPEVFFKRRMGHVYFYGAGCGSEEKKGIVSASLIAQFKVPVTVESDLLAAARGLFLKEKGIACILGTGSNSCFYDGEKIVKNVRPAGYILGDEGGSALLGKMFLADVLKEIAPQRLVRDFYDKVRISPDRILESVYGGAFPNRFLATISYFLDAHLESEYVYELFMKNLRDYFTRCVCQYDYKNYPIRFVGSFAAKHIDLIYEVAAECGIEVDLILESPISGLIEYHASTD